MHSDHSSPSLIKHSSPSLISLTPSSTHHRRRPNPAQPTSSQASPSLIALQLISLTHHRRRPSPSQALISLIKLSTPSPSQPSPRRRRRRRRPSRSTSGQCSLFYFVVNFFCYLVSVHMNFFCFFCSGFSVILWSLYWQFDR